MPAKWRSGRGELSSCASTWPTVLRVFECSNAEGSWARSTRLRTQRVVKASEAKSTHVGSRAASPHPLRVGEESSGRSAPDTRASPDLQGTQRGRGRTDGIDPTGVGQGCNKAFGASLRRESARCCRSPRGRIPQAPRGISGRPSSRFTRLMSCQVSRLRAGSRSRSSGCHVTSTGV